MTLLINMFNTIEIEADKLPVRADGSSTAAAPTSDVEAFFLALRNLRTVIFKSSAASGDQRTSAILKAFAPIARKLGTDYTYESHFEAVEKELLRRIKVREKERAKRAIKKKSAAAGSPASSGDASAASGAGGGASVSRMTEEEKREAEEDALLAAALADECEDDNSSPQKKHKNQVEAEV